MFLVSFAFRRSVAEIFRIHVISNPDVRTPVVTFGTTTFFHIRTDNLYLCAVSKLNVNTALVRGGGRKPERPWSGGADRPTWPVGTRAQVFEFLYKFVDICKSYFNKLDEDVLKDNYVLVYELLDGACPRTLEDG